jgi:ribose 5-phosphate isomerase A
MDQLATMAVAGVKSGMIVGLGTGRAAARGVRALAEKVKVERLNITCVATSIATAELGASLGLKIVDFATVQRVDYLFDGSDELDPQGQMLKGGGGAMTRERIVAAASVVCVNILDDSKLVKHLGERYPLPIEIIPMALSSVRCRLREELKLEGPVRKRKDAAGKPAVEDLISDNGNFIVDVKLTVSHDVRAIAAALDKMAGVVDHGLFLDEAQIIMIEDKTGSVTRRDRS